MASDKIDNSIIYIGIDLGTTNSEIAITLNDPNGEVIKNGRGDEYTPSVFGIDKGGNPAVGKVPYSKLFLNATDDELENNKAEVKRLMGTNEKIKFTRINKTYSPEEISAEILKSLKNDLLKKYPNIPTSVAVITVPAYFDVLQNEATKRAGQLAGFDYVVLLQEPIAAAISYGLSNASDNANWLVYDLGGGTFDVALISSQDGVLKVLEHGGDNFLGGKDIDNALVEKVLVPAILKDYKLKDFEKSNKKYKTIFAKLKGIAEEAKISLSSSDVTNIVIDTIGTDDDGKDIFVSFDYTTKEFNELIRPLIDKTIETVNGVIERSKVAKKFISKIVFVGGPTQIPYLRERVKNDVGIEIDTSVDPLTTVAKGASIYGLGCRVPDEIMQKDHRPVSKKEIQLTLNYESMTSDEDEMVTGSLDLPDDGEYYIKISSESGYYNSANIKVKNGKFFDTLAIEPNKTNKFWIYLIDEKGNNIPVFPDSFSITHGLSIQGAPIPHDIGVIYSRKSFDSDFQYVEACDKYFDRNSILPLECTKTFKTIKLLEKDAKNPLPIYVYEGDSDNPELNERVTQLFIDGKAIPYNLPKGTDVDLTIKINESRELFVEAYVPSIDLTIESKNVRLDTYAQNVDNDKLRHELEVQKQRVSDANVSEEEKKSLQSEIDSIESGVDNSNDSDSQQKASRDIKKLRERIDVIESSSEIDVLVDEFHKLYEETEAIINETKEHDNSVGERLGEQLAQIKDAGRTAIDQQDKYMLTQLNEQLVSLKVQALSENPYFWVIMLEQLQSKDIDSFSNPSEAEYHLNAAVGAKNTGDVEGLKRHVREVLRLLPQDEQAGLTANMSGITK